MTLYGDGWYLDRETAKAMLAHLDRDFNARPVGLVESADGGWGLLYWSKERLYPGHEISEPDHAFRVR